MLNNTAKKITNHEPTISNTAAVVVTYKPDKDSVNNISNLCNIFTKVIVVNNSNESKININIDKPILHVITNEKNLGLALALNQGCKEAIRQGYAWCATFDQDTIVFKNYLKNMLEQAKPIENLAVLGCNYYDRNSRKNKIKGAQGYSERTTVITSGALTNLSIWEEIGYFREEFFIDAIDHEFCLKARRKNFGVYIAHKPLMEHSIGSARDAQINIPTHNPSRTYTKSRNTTRLIIEYSRIEPLWALKKIGGLIVEAWNIIFHEKEKKAHLSFFLMGLKDGITKQFERDLSA